MGTNLKESMNIGQGEVISLVGGGGKTTLMFALAKELAHPGKIVISGTTTKIMLPDDSETQFLLLSQNIEELLRFIRKNEYGYEHITIAAEKIGSSGKLKGIDRTFTASIAKLKNVQNIIIEADGAGCRPLKAPNTNFEPVIPENTTLLIVVVGVDSLGCPLNEKNVLRSDIASQLTGQKTGDIVTSKTIASLITHTSGIAFGCPENARIIPFINKVDMCEHLDKAREIAYEILERRHPKIERVILGQAKLEPPVLEIVRP